MIKLIRTSEEVVIVGVIYSDARMDDGKQKVLQYKISDLQNTWSEYVTPDQLETTQ
jgi:hypothetical protein